MYKFKISKERYLVESVINGKKSRTTFIKPGQTATPYYDPKFKKIIFKVTNEENE